MKIEKNISITESYLGRPVKYPFPDMEVGDSIFFEGEDASCKQYSAARIWGARNGRKFSARKVEGGVRIWRIE